MERLFANPAISRARAAADAYRDGRGDFAVLTGGWSVEHRRLRRRLAGDSAWDEFAGICESLPILGGLGQVDDNFLDLPGGASRAVTLRRFDPSIGRWSIWWGDGRTGRLDPPVQGRFEAGVGTFSGVDTLEGRTLQVRYIWSEMSPASARWEQAFSADRGAHWETNWIMQFRPAAAGRWATAKMGKEETEL
ncbi:MAG: hypothetical protein ACRD2E_11225 [Terriglobales bacterium]